MSRKEVAFKIYHVFLPLVLVSGAFCVVYSALNWLLVAGTGALPIDEEVVDIWLPFGLAFVLEASFIGPRYRALKLASNIQAIYFLVAVATIAVPAVIAQAYVKNVSGAITNVQSGPEIARAAETKYYSTSTPVCLARDAPLVHPAITTGGSRSQSLDFRILLATPLCGERGADARRSPVWVLLKYEHSMSNSASDAEKRKEYRKFASQTEAEYDALDTSQYHYFERLGFNTDRHDIEKEFKRARLKVPGIILVPHVESFAQRTGHSLEWSFGSFAVGAAIWFFMVMLPTLDRNRIRTQRKEQERGEPSTGYLLARMFVIPSRENYGLPLLIDINVLVFLAMALAGLGFESFQSDDLLAWGANYGPAIHGMGVLRLFTCQFVHAGLMHLLSNMYGLFVAGFFLTSVAHNARLLVCYLMCGLAGSIASVVVHPSILSVGASGSIMGLWGIAIALVLLRDRRIVDGSKIILVNAAAFVGLTLLQGALAKGIDNSAHLGGLVTGLVLGLAIYVFDRGWKAQLPTKGPSLEFEKD